MPKKKPRASKPKERKASAQCDPSLPLANQRHEAFARNIVSGKDATAAYRSTYKVRGTSAEVSASRLIRNTKVKARIQFLQQQAASKTVMDMQERRERLARYVRADLHKLDLEKDGDLLQEIIRTTDKDGGQSVKVKLPGKRECIMADAELAGELIEKHEIKDTTPREPLEAIRERVQKAAARHIRK